MHRLLLAAALVLTACHATPDEDVATSHSKIDARFDPNHRAPVQTDDWSCSVHTTTWMLQATGHDVTWSQISRTMQDHGRVSMSLGLLDASGAGLARTLRENADGSPDVGNVAYASFDDVASRAGQMAIGIGGRAWNHWTAVRGYDAGRDVILLANSAPGWKGAGQELDRGEFARLGGMAMVWMDYGQTPVDVPPFEPTPRPTGGAFEALHVNAPIGAGEWVTQCNESADGERVWQSTSGGPDPETRWAEAKYPQAITSSCGEPSPEGIHPLVFRSANAGSFGAWVTQCTGSLDGYQAVYRTDAEVDGRPAAVFLYVEPNADCY
jgi:hypothetical protein